MSPAEYEHLSELAAERAEEMDDAARAKYALRFIEQDALGVAQLDAFIASEVLAGLIADAEDFKAEGSIAA